MTDTFEPLDTVGTVVSDATTPIPTYTARAWVVVGVGAFTGILLTLLVGALPGLVAATVIIAALELIRRPRDVVSLLSALLVLTFLVPAQLVFVPLGGSASPATLFGLLLLWYWLVARLVPSLGLDRGRQPIRIGVMIWLWATVASVGAAYARAGIDGTELQATNRGVVVSAAAAGITLLAADGIATRARLDALVRVLVWLGAILAFIGLLQFTVGVDLAGAIRVPGLGIVNPSLTVGVREGFPRVAGTATHPIEFAGVLAALFPLALYYGSSVSRRRMLRWVPLVLMLLAIPTSLSRTAGVAMIAAVLFLWPTWTWRRRTEAAGLVVVGIAVVQLVYPGVLETFLALFTGAGQDVSVTTRTSDYADALPYIQSGLLFGRGVRTFDPGTYFFVDNQWLLQLIETGLVGFLAMAAMFVIAITLARGARNRSIEAGPRELGQSIAASIAALAVCAFTFDAFGFPMVTVVTFLMFGLAGAAWRLSRREQHDREHPDPASRVDARAADADLIG